MQNDRLAKALRTWQEAMAKPGILSRKGWQIRNSMLTDTAAYFKSMAASVDLSHVGTANHYGLIEPHVRKVLTDHQPMLLKAYQTHGKKAFLLSGSLSVLLDDGQMVEASFDLPSNPVDIANQDAQLARLDRLGLTGKQAVDYLNEHGAELVKGLDAYSIKVMRELIAKGIEDQLGVRGTVALIRSEFTEMATGRARSIATTEINDAMSEASLQKIALVGLDGKRWIHSPGACPICLANAAQGIIPVGEAFQSGQMRPPGHPGKCLCAVAGARLSKASSFDPANNQGRY